MQDAFLQVLSTNLAAAYLIVILAGITRGFTGFAAGLVNIALLTLLYGPVEAIGLASLFGIISSLMLLRKTAHQINWSDTAPLCAAIVVTTPLGAMLLFVAETTFVKPTIGAFIIASGLALFFGWKYSGPRNGYAATAVGAACGGLFGFAGSGGPLMVFYYLATPEPAPVQRANIAATVTVLSVIMVLSLLYGGGIGLETFLRAALLVPGTIIGTWVGMRLFEIAPQKLYRTVAQIVLIAIGFMLILS